MGHSYFRWSSLGAARSPNSNHGVATPDTPEIIVGVSESIFTCHQFSSNIFVTRLSSYMQFESIVFTIRLIHHVLTLSGSYYLALLFDSQTLSNRFESSRVVRSYLNLYFFVSKCFLFICLVLNFNIKHVLSFLCFLFSPVN